MRYCISCALCAASTHVRDDPVECAPGISKAVLAGGELAEVFRGPGHYVVIELEHYAPRRLVVDSHVELRVF